MKQIPSGNDNYILQLQQEDILDVNKSIDQLELTDFIGYPSSVYNKAEVIFIENETRFKVLSDRTGSFKRHGKTEIKDSGKYEFKLPVTPIGKTQIIYAELNASMQLLHDCIMDRNFIDSIRQAADVIIESFRAGGKLIICGNGGSMCDAMHFAAELTGRFKENRKPFPAIAISDPAHLSCVANDFGYIDVFTRYVMAMTNPQDVVFGISTSGKSANVHTAGYAATDFQKCKFISLTGNGGGSMGAIANVNICVPHTGYADKIQEIHIKVIHILCTLIEQELTK